MNLSIRTTLLCALAAAPSLVSAQGPLVPPATGGGAIGPNAPLVGGNPAPTMKTLHQVEPRTPVSATTTPGDGSNEFIISASGSYYLTGNLAVAGKNAISITAADVTLDLNGFTISGFASNAGILVRENADRCTIRNGHILNTTFGINRTLSGSDEAAGGLYENLTVSGHGSIGLLGGNGWTVLHCRIQGGGNSGIVVGEGSVVSHCTVRDMDAVSGTHGIQARDGSVIKDCAVSGCDVVYGIRGGTGSVVENCTARENTSAFTGFGVSAGIFVDARSVVRGCTSSGNTHTSSAQLFGSGISAEFSCLVVDCMANQNDGAGIVVAQASEVRNCKTHFNGQNGPGAGILCDNFDPQFPVGWNKIIGNDSTFNQAGIDVDTTANLIIQNTFRGNFNEANLDIIANNNVGPVILPGASGAINGFGSGGGGVSTTNPWANFSW